MRSTRVMLMIVAAATGCGGGSGDGGTDPGGTPASVSVAAAPAGAMTTLGATRTLTATVRDASQRVLSNAAVTWSSANGQVVSLSGTSGRSVTATAEGDGTARVTATSGSASGTVDLVVQTTGFPGQADVTALAASAFSPATVDIATGGTVTWTFQALHNVTFDPAAGAPANIADRSSGSEQRTFAQTGSFSYHCTIHAGMSGTVVVH
jgi:plastocyanin